MRRALALVAIALAVTAVGITGFALATVVPAPISPAAEGTGRAYIDQEWKPVGDGRAVLRCTYHNSDGSVQVIEGTPVSIYATPTSGTRCSPTPLR